MNRIRKRLLFLFLVCIAMGILNIGCSDEATPESDDKILKPVAENVIGKWSMKESYKKLDGKWVEDPIPEGQGQTYTIRTDGTVLSAFTAPDGYTKLNLGEWETDEAANKLTLGTMTVDVLSLNATSFEMGYGEALDAETGELMDGEFRWKYSRMDETQKTLAEKLIGKWNYSKSYEKINGEWVEIHSGMQDEGWFLGETDILFCEDGSSTVYARFGEHERTLSMYWRVNNATGELRMVTKDGQIMELNVAIGVDGTLSVFYNLELSTGQTVTREFKNVLIR
ncbi:hypothetical protein [Bacteroides cellulosilyticus]|uniref:hypothetical protein n=1 Tax=Bacteroides cellulosilyticus TaxID=246787 RepID=UPI0032EB631A